MAVVLGEENGIATCALLGRGMQVVSVASRRLTEWEGGEGRKLQSTPIDKSFVERARAYRAGEPVPDQFEGLKVEVRSSKGKEQLSEAADEMDARKKGKGKVVEEGTSKKGAGRGRAKNTTAEEGPAKKKGKIGKGEEGGAAGTAKDRKRKAGLDESAQGGAKRQKSTTDPVVAGAAGPSGAAVGGSGGTGTQAGQSAADTAREHHPPVQTQDAYKRFEDDFLVDPEENVGGDL